MSKVDTLLHAFNVGVFDKDKLHRVDLTRMRLAAERQTNMIGNAVGQAPPRPGTEFIASIGGFFRPLDFGAGVRESAVLCLGNQTMQVCDASTDVILTRPAVTTVVQSGEFSASTGWTLSAAAGQATTVTGGELNLQARAHGARAVASQQVTVAGGNVGVEHGLRVDVHRGPLDIRVGSASGLDDYVAFTSLRTGVHSLGFTPTGDFWIELSSNDPALKLVGSCQIEGTGVVSIPTPWPTAAVGLVRASHSLDVLFCACEGYRPQRIERRNDGRSWSVCDYQFSDGPFQAGPYVEGLTLAPSTLEGYGTLTSNLPFFTTDHIGALFRLFHTGQSIDTYLAAADQYTDPINITGITETNFEERVYTYAVAGTWAGTLRNRRAFDSEDGSYHDMRRAQTVATVDITANASYTNDDNDDNIDEWVKIGFPPGLYTSGEARITANYPNGGDFGICRVLGFTDSTHVTIEVLRSFRGTAATADWRKSRYDGLSGWPTAVAFVDGRLAWSADDIFDASISDAFEGFDEDFVGESGPLSRSIALGGRNLTRWMLPLSSLMIGCEGRIANVRASSLDEVLTPDNLGMKSAGAVGAASISPVELADDRGIYVHLAGVSLYEITWSPEKARYVTAPFSKLTTDLFAGGISELAIQTLPDQRIWVSNMNNDAVCIVYEPGDDVLAAHFPISTSVDTDFFEGFTVVPGIEQDRVYAAVRRVINGVTVYYLEKFALDTEVKIDTVCKVMDFHVSGTGAHSATITGLDHAEGRQVVAWVDGAPVTDPAITDPALDNSMIFTVVGGEITLPDAPTEGYCVGGRYEWEYKTARLAYGIDGYSPMLKNKSIAGVGIMLSDFVRSGVKYGTTFLKDTFLTPFNLPRLSSATGDVADEVVAGPNDDEFEVSTDSKIVPDARLCIAGASPKPFTLQSLVIALDVK